MTTIKVHEEFYSVDTTDEWKDRTTVTIYYHDSVTGDLSVEKTTTLRDYRSKSESSEKTTSEIISIDKAPAIVRDKLRELGLAE